MVSDDQSCQAKATYHGQAQTRRPSVHGVHKLPLHVLHPHYELVLRAQARARRLSERAPPGCSIRVEAIRIGVELLEEVRVERGETVPTVAC